MMHRVYAGIGSNIDPKNNVSNCLLLLKDEFSDFVQSRYYQTSPYGYMEQDNFLNVVVGFSTQHTPTDLLRRFQEIESQFKRKREIKDGPRTLDLDILLYESIIINEPDLKIPHPGLIERDFFLLPLIEIAPQLTFPITGETLSQLTDKICHRHIINDDEA